MNNRINIGIIGFGFVGSSVAYGFSPQTGFDKADLRIYDKDPSRSTHTLEEVLQQSDFIFLSVPTPSNIDGSINLSILENVLKEVNDYGTKDGCIVLVRSTIVPGTTRKFKQKYKNITLVFNPEFLTERSAKFDFINQARFILGGHPNDTAKVAKLFVTRFGSSTPTIETNFETAEFIKYMNNCYFATKVSFMNEMKLIADKNNVNWTTAVDGFVRDGRIGHSHLAVPGPDGKFGFGGSCFPKDIQAMISHARQSSIRPHVLEGAWKTNLNVRPERDWENLLGRAIIEEKKNER
jgi:nucleotide sugar dehydrogenase